MSLSPGHRLELEDEPRLHAIVDRMGFPSPGS